MALSELAGLPVREPPILPSKKNVERGEPVPQLNWVISVLVIVLLVVVILAVAGAI